MDEFVSALSTYRHPDHVFVNSGTRPYRAERYTLSSREGLTPDAVQLLVEAIERLPLDTQPQLLVDASFKRGFVFAYGILNNELLFESEYFRRHFFEPAEDSSKCDRFCEKWGYTAFFVDEGAIFLDGRTSLD
jgi:hypothetical protein